MPTSAITLKASLASDTAAYEALSYKALRPELHFDDCYDVKPTNQTHPGSSVTFFIYNDLATATATLTEGSDVTPVALSDNTVSVTVGEYGNATTTSAQIRGQSLLNVDEDAANIVGFNAGKSFDTLARDPLLAGTNVRYSDATTPQTNNARNTILAADTLQARDVRRALVDLRVANAQTFDGNYYRSYIAPEVSLDLRAETGAAAWRDPHTYSQPGEIWNGEVGAFEGFRFIETSRLSAGELPAGFVNSGSPTTVDVYPTLFMGKQAGAKVWAKKINGPTPMIVLSPVTDILQRFRGIGWKWMGGFGRFREAALVRYESASSVGAN